MEYKIIVKGYVIATCKSEEEADKKIHDLTYSVPALIHPKDHVYVVPVKA